MRKRIVMLAGNYYPQVGGGELLDARHAQLLRARGFDVSVVVGTSPPYGPSTDPWGTPFERVPRWRLGGFSFVTPRCIERALDETAPAVLYCAGPEPHDAYAVRAAARRGIATALLYHADFRSDRAPSRIATRAYVPLAGRRFDLVVTTTAAYRQRLVARGLASDRVVDAGMGVDAAFFVPPDSFEPHANARVLFVGRLDANHTYKRLDLLLEAIAQLEASNRRIELTVVGDGDRRAFFETTARSLHLSNATFLGEIGGDDLRRAYQRADVLVLPSPTAGEGFGLVVLEAYACGCPAVTHAAAGSSGVVAACGCGAVWRGELPSELAAAVASVLDDPSPRAAIASRARGYVEREHSWEAVGDRLAGAFEHLLGQEGRSR